MDNLLTYILLIYLGMAKPGPGVAFFTALTLSDGLKASTLTLLGCAFSHVCIVFILLLGFEATQGHGSLVDLMQVCALTVLFIYGLHYFFKASPQSLINEFMVASQGVSDGQKARQGLSRFLKGLVWPFTNPFNYVMYGSLLPILMGGSEFLSVKMVLFLPFVTGILVIAGVFPYMVAAEKVLKRLKGGGWIVRNMHKITGVFCMGISLSFLPGLIKVLL